MTSLDSFGDWLKQSEPTWNWDWRHLRYIRHQLARIERGEANRLMIFCPPQHGKSEQNTIRWPIYQLERDPRRRLAIATYNQRQANKFSRASRKIARARSLPLSLDRKAANEWELTTGGSMIAVGVGVSVAGNAVDLLVIDDCIGKREDAESPAYRDKVWDWYRDDIYTRLQPGAAAVLIQTRWHEDDLPGRILNSDDATNWEVVNLPAEAEEDDPLGRVEGEPLCPERFSAKELADRRRVLGIGYSSLYQGRPVPKGGSLFRRDHFDLAQNYPTTGRFVRAWDKAGTADGGDWSAGVLWTRCPLSGLFYIVDVIRGQWSWGQREAIIKQTAELDRLEYGWVTTWIEEEPGSGGKESAERTVSQLAGHDVHTERASGEKVYRWSGMAAQYEARNIRIVLAEWTNTFLDEHVRAPRGKHDDQVDAAALGFNKLAAMAMPVAGTGISSGGGSLGDLERMGVFG